MYCSRCGTQNEDNAKFCKSCGLDLTATTPVHAINTGQQEVTEIDLVRDQLKEEYEILDELGRGGMAIVFKAREKQLERDVAIKVLPFSLAFDKEFVERFQREARTSAKLEHPGIIPIYRVGKSGRVIYFVMKFLRGKPLSTVLNQRGALPPADIRRILTEVGRALGYAHKSDIVHRDVKPDNIMFDDLGQAVVTDFGIAKAASGGKLTGTGMAIGTPHYMSPEQARAQPLDGRSDIYSLGVVAYVCLTGAVPFDGEDSFSIGYKHIMEALPTPDLKTDEHRHIFEIVKKMMAKVPEERFQTAEQMVEAVDAGGYVATGISTAATRAMPSIASPRVTAGLTGREPASTPAESEKPKSTVGGLAIFVTVLLVLGGAVWYFGIQQGLISRLLSKAVPVIPVDTSHARDSTALAGAAPATDTTKHDTTHAPGTTGAGTADAPKPKPTPTQSLAVICAEPGPEYNRGKACYDTPPSPTVAPFINLPADATEVPRRVILAVHVSPEGTTLEVRTVMASDVDSITSRAVEMAKSMQWTPAMKSGATVDAWIQQQFVPRRQN
ncbi:MAG TPA: protein kinase [Gemmatimonadales bacterium]|nr:protein kinase [Gemmatimonadales bacterium]